MPKDSSNSIHRILVLLTRGSSLSKWKMKGILTREMALYKKLSQDFGYDFLSYGKNDQNLLSELPNGSTVIQNSRQFLPPLYQASLAWFERRRIAAASLIKTNQINGAGLGVYLKRLFRKKLLVRCGMISSRYAELKGWSSEKKLKRLRHERTVFSYADLIFVPTAQDKDYVERQYSVEPKKIKIVPNYVDTEIFKPLPAPKKDPIQICTVLKDSPQKNAEALIKACEGIKGIQLVVVGDIAKNPECVRLVSQSGILAHFTGVMPNDRLAGLFRESTLFVLPSLYEGHPKALLEAMAAALPVIGTRVPGIQEIIRDGQNGFLCETSADSIRQAILAALAQKQKLEPMGLTARAEVVANYSLDRCARLEKEYISELIG